MRFDIKMHNARENTKKMLAQMEEENPKMFVSLKAAFNNLQTNTFFQKEFLDA